MALDFAPLADALRRTPLDVVAARLGMGVADLRDALVAEGRDRGAQDAAWWPEALRRLEVESLRAVARFFHCEPRRIRRALAREGLRVAGVDLAERRVPQLARAPLGQFSDSDIARRNGVIPEAVAGERRRRNIAPFQPGKRRRWVAAEPEVVRVAHAPEGAVPSTPRRLARAEEGGVRSQERAPDPLRERDRRVREFFRNEREEAVVRSVGVRPAEGRRVVRAAAPPPSDPTLPERATPTRRPLSSPPTRRNEPSWRSIASDLMFVQETERVEPSRSDTAIAPPPPPALPEAVVARARELPPHPVSSRISAWRAIFAAGPTMHLAAGTLAGALDEARSRAGVEPLRVERLAG